MSEVSKRYSTMPGSAEAVRQGAWVKKIRTRRLAMTQAAFAEELKVTSGTVSNVETGALPMSNLLWGKICAAIGEDGLTFPRFDPEDANGVLAHAAAARDNAVQTPTATSDLVLPADRHLTEAEFARVYEAILPWLQKWYEYRFKIVKSKLDARIANLDKFQTACLYYLAPQYRELQDEVLANARRAPDLPAKPVYMALAELAVCTTRLAEFDLIEESVIKLGVQWVKRNTEIAAEQSKSAKTIEALRRDIESQRMQLEEYIDRIEQQPDER